MKMMIYLIVEKYYKYTCILLLLFIYIIVILITYEPMFINVQYIDNMLE
jgi:hypothetical protein